MVQVRREHELPDAYLIDRIWAGESQAFEVLVRRYQGRLYNFICLSLGSCDVALDILQCVWI